MVFVSTKKLYGEFSVPLETHIQLNGFSQKRLILQ